MAKAPFLVSPHELSSLVASSSASVKILDASWFMPNSPRNAETEFGAKRIPKAQFFDLDKVASPHELGLKHMMPSNHQFKEACDKWQIGNDDHVVIYDTQGVFSSPRALFTFRAFNHDRSSILNGGLPAWEAQNYPVELGPIPEPVQALGESELATKTYKLPEMDPSVIKDYEQIAANCRLDPQTSLSAELVLDARSKGRWTGADPETRPSLSSGHMPHSISLPFNQLVQTHTVPETGTTYTTLRGPEELKKSFQAILGDEELEAVLSGQRKLVNSCGSGMTAAINWLCLQIIGCNSAIYDESWTGYASRPESIILKGERSLEERV
ncbi:Rhodanese-like protein [Sistotremastrum niveocremeum HHB9708]|uniref:Rhodanese-like protein n=1 Tax=Sistotremastrum niveocremeum HHB9708 TaxID=1314777 RepID=A0A164XNF6_9AGAM|nr:Rhodanese-like protein [Sistotremastrum niveocremeum HHB9708]